MAFDELVQRDSLLCSRWSTQPRRESSASSTKDRVARHIIPGHHERRSGYHSVNWFVCGESSFVGGGDGCTVSCPRRSLSTPITSCSLQHTAPRDGSEHWHAPATGNDLHRVRCIQSPSKQKLPLVTAAWRLRCTVGETSRPLQFRADGSSGASARWYSARNRRRGRCCNEIASSVPEVEGQITKVDLPQTRSSSDHLCALGARPVGALL